MIKKKKLTNDILREIKIIRKNLQLIMKKGLVIEPQGNGTRKITFPKPEKDDLE